MARFMSGGSHNPAPEKARLHCSPRPQQIPLARDRRRAAKASQVFASSLIVAWGTLLAVPSCSKSASPPPAGDAAIDATHRDVSVPPIRDASHDTADAADAGIDMGPDFDAALTPYCAALAVYAQACGLGHDICDDAGVRFAADCDTEDIDVNSATFEAAEMACFTPANCSPAALVACDYAQFPTHTPTATQAKLVSDYCATCAPDASSCATTAIEYEASDADAATVSAIFTAAWQYSDLITGQIDELCTGAALEVNDAGSCDDAFGACVQRYVGVLPAVVGLTECK
jgi:hypothetical protein